MGVPVVGVAAVKGGVGKTAISAALAVTLVDQGYRVGFLDADIDSPFAPEVLGVKDKVGLTTDRKMAPVTAHGLQFMSFGAWLPEDRVGITMKGEMHGQWINDAIKHTDWGGLDLLVVDFPAGSSDEFLTVRSVLGQDLVGLIAVAVPSAVSGLERVYGIASTTQVRILGCIENMAGPVFGEGKVEAYCDEKGLRFLGSVPLDQGIRERHDAGEPRLPYEHADPIYRAASVVVKHAELSAPEAEAQAEVE